MTTYEWLKAELVSQLGIRASEVEPSAELWNDLGADSLDFIELVIAAEEQFNIEIRDDEVKRTVTVQQVVDLIDQKVKEKR